MKTLIRSIILRVCCACITIQILAGWGISTPHTSVILHNDLDTNFNCVLTELDNALPHSAHYPNKNDAINIATPNQKISTSGNDVASWNENVKDECIFDNKNNVSCTAKGIATIAQFSRNVSIKKGQDYSFTETIYLPDTSPINLKQHIKGTTTSSDELSAAVAVPELNIKEQWFSDRNKHTVSVPNKKGGNYIITFYLEAVFPSYDNVIYNVELKK